MGQGKLVDLERERLGNDIFGHPLNPQMVVMNPADGMPQVSSMVSMTDTLAPVLDPETLICMGDDSVFEIKDVFGEVLVTLMPDQVRRTTMGLHFAEIAKLTPGQQQVVAAHSLHESDRKHVRAYPRKIQCQHYKRVMTDFEGNAEHRQVERVCAAQRTEGGEYVSLRDTRVYACEHRSPRDFVSEERLRKFDADRVREGKKAEEEYDVMAALAAAAEKNGENHV